MVWFVTGNERGDTARQRDLNAAKTYASPLANDGLQANPLGAARALPRYLVFTGNPHNLVWQRRRRFADKAEK